jgi:nitrite reductase (NADH) small subunit
VFSTRLGVYPIFMAELVRILGTTELPGIGEAREVSCNGKMLCIANVGGSISAMDNVCPHRGGPLGEGIVENGKVVCPWHAWAFDVVTGEAEHSPNDKVEVYPVKIDGDDVLVALV